MKRHALTITAAALLAATVLAAAGCQGGHKQTHLEAVAPVSVRTVAVAPAAVADQVEVTGSLHGAREAVLSAKVMGTVTAIRKTAGETVRRGEVVIVLDDREVAGNIAQAEGALAQA
jgi:multidrug efflux pump subunit AcrA (membrane-fusion protein)